MKHLTTTVLLALWMSGLAPARDSPARTNDVLVQVELLELPHETVQALMRDKVLATDATALRVHLQDLVRRDEAAILESVMLRTRDGGTGSAGSNREWIHPTEFEPPELPHSLGMVGTSPNTRFVPRSPELPKTPTAFVTVDVGVSLSATPAVRAKRAAVSLSLELMLTRHLRNTEWVKRQTPAGNTFASTMPEFERLQIPVHLEVPDGRFALAGLLRRDGAPDKRIMVFVRCDVLEVIKDE